MMNTVYFAKHILLESGDILVNGAVSVSAETGLIMDIGPRGAVRRSSNERTVNLGDILLLPGFINMHTHLEESPIRSFGRKESSDETFAAWNSKKYSRMRRLTDAQVRNGIKLSARDMVSSGITTVVDSTRTGISAEVLAGEPIRAVILKEIADEDFLDEGIEQVRGWLGGGGSAFGYGIGPHALYSLSPRHQRRLIDFGRGAGCLWACHAAESAEELQAFCERSGDFFFSVTRRKPWPAGDSRLPPVRYALSKNLIPPRGVLFHCNYVTSGELELLAAKQTFVTLCVKYGSNMEHKSFPVEVARNRGIRICLGTEGMIPAGAANLFDDLFTLKTAYPHISAAEMLGWVTKNPAAALKASDSLGGIRAGKLADIIGARFPYDGGDILEALLLSDPDIAFVMVGGEEIIV